MGAPRALTWLILLGPFVAALTVFMVLRRTATPAPAPHPSLVDPAQVEAPAPPAPKLPSATTRPHDRLERSPQRGPTSPASHLSGPLGHLQASHVLVRSFLQQEEGHRAFLDFTLDGAAFQGSLDDGDLVIWERCEALEPGEAPNMSKCSGWSLRLDPASEIPHSQLLFRQGDSFRLRGHFGLGPCDGPHQGLMGCLLIPLDT